MQRLTYLCNSGGQGCGARESYRMHRCMPAVRAALYTVRGGRYSRPCMALSRESGAVGVRQSERGLGQPRSHRRVSAHTWHLARRASPQTYRSTRVRSRAVDQWLAWRGDILRSNETRRTIYPAHPICATAISRYHDGRSAWLGHH